MAALGPEAPAAPARERLAAGRAAAASRCAPAAASRRPLLALRWSPGLCAALFAPALARLRALLDLAQPLRRLRLRSARSG
jgi:hypothetical protein